MTSINTSILPVVKSEWQNQLNVIGVRFQLNPRDAAQAG